MNQPENHNDSDPRDDDPRQAQRVDPQTGQSDDPRVEPKRDGGGATG